MESTDLRIFLAVAKYGSITKAAESLNYVQSNVSAHLKRLEAELNTSLFLRTSSGVTMTKSGEELLAYANQIIGLLDKAKSHFVKPDAKLRIGAIQSIAASRLPTWLSECKDILDSASLSIVTGDQNRLAEQLLNDKLDCIFTNINCDNPLVKNVWIFYEHLSVVAPATCQSIDDIFQYSPIVNTYKGCPYRDALLRWLNSQGSNNQQIIEMDTIESMLNAVAHDMGITLLPNSVTENMSSIKRFNVADIKPVPIELYILEKQINPTLSTFIQRIKSLEQKSVDSII